MDNLDDDLSETQDLVQRLVVEAGQLIEDASPDFAVMLPAARSMRIAKLSAMLASIEATASLMRSAVSLASL